VVEDVYVHIGHPKTGTGSIQQTFRASADVLRADGLLYDARPRNHHAVAHAAHAGPRRERRSVVRISERFFELLGRAREPAALLSTEALIRLSEEEAAALVARLSRHAERVTVVMYVRHPLAAANSFAHEGVRIGRPLEEIVAAPRVLPLRQIVKRWESAADGRIVVRPFASALFTNGDVLDDLLAVMGRPELGGRLTRVRLNDPLSVLGIHLLDRAHRIGFMPRDATRIFEGIGGPRYVLPAEALEKVRLRAEPELAFLRTRFGIELPEPRESPTAPPGLDEETLVSIAAVLRKAALYGHDLDGSLRGRLMERPSPFTRREDQVTHPLAPVLRRLGVTGWLAASAQERRKARVKRRGKPRGRSDASRRVAARRKRPS